MIQRAYGPLARLERLVNVHDFVPRGVRLDLDAKGFEEERVSTRDQILDGAFAEEKGVFKEDGTDFLLQDLQAALSKPEESI